MFHFDYRWFCRNRQEHHLAATLRRVPHPRLGSDTIGRAIKASEGIKNGHAYWVAYDVLFSLCGDFVQAGASVVLDMTMGWAFQWERVDAIPQRHSQTRFVPIILRCSLETCIERARLRYIANPEHYDPPEVYTTELKNREIWDFLSHLSRPEVYFVDASRSQDEVYTDVREYISSYLGFVKE